MESELKIPSPLNKLNYSLANEKGVELFIKRDDLIDNVISGNKWRKLALNIERCKQEKYDGILTFGGAYSNHIRATARAAKLVGVKSIGIIRGDELNPLSNQTLSESHLDGMQLVFTSRQEYALRDEKYYEEELRRRHGNYLIVSEGGANFLGVLGCVQIIKELGEIYDHIFLAGGTGTTAAGLLYAQSSTQIHLVPALKGGEFLRKSIRQLLFQAGLDDETLNECDEKLTLHTDYHFGGYGKHSSDLIDFMNDFYNETQIALDQVYTAKTMFALVDQLKKNGFKAGEKILFLHTGGLQGIHSIQDQLIY